MEKLQEVAAPKYEIRSLLGFGGMAGVYLAHEPKLGRDVAIKVMSPSLMMDDALVDRFEQEARTTAQLSHPNIVTILDVEQSEDLHYFAMTYVPGRTLSEIMFAAGAPLPLAAVATWLTQVASALDYAHRRGVVHRDVKPGNVIMGSEGDAHVTDFGIAKVTSGPSLTRTGVLVGTPSYMSPEQCMSGVVTSASDQYALGAVAYQMLSGEPPFTGPTLAVMHAHVNDPPSAILDSRPDCPRELASTVERMLEKSPEDRWPSLFDVIDAIAPHVPSRTDPVRTQIVEMGQKVWGLTVESPQGPVTAGDAVPLAATPHDLHGRLLVSRKVDWQSSDPNIVAVQQSDLKAMRSGTATVTATCEGVTQSVLLHVDEPGRAPVSSGVSTTELGSEDTATTGASRPAVTTDPAETPGAAPSPESASPSPPDTVSSASLGADAPAGTARAHLNTAGDPAAWLDRSAGSSAPGSTEKARGPASADGPGWPKWVGWAAALALIFGFLGVVLLGQPGQPDTPASPASGALPSGGIGAESPQPGIGTEAEVAGAGEAPTGQTAVGTPPPSPANGAILIDRGQLPAGARVFLTGDRRPEQLVAGDSVALSPGNYGLRAEALGYAPADLQIDLASGTLRSWVPVLEPLAAADDPPVDASEPLPVATDGLVLIRGVLPPGAAIVIGGPTLSEEYVESDSVVLPPGTYTLLATAPGYLSDELELELGPGTTRTWAPDLRPVPTTREPEVPPRDSITPVEAPAPDPALVLQGIRAEVEGLARAIQARNVDAANAAYPGASQWIEGIAAVLQSSSVQNLTASVVSVTVTESGDGVASADFRIRLSFQNRSVGQQQPMYRFSGVFGGSGSQWTLTQLTVTEVTQG